MPKLNGQTHVGISVSDLEASAGWYSSVFDVVLVREGRRDDEGFSFRTFVDPTSFVGFALMQHDANPGDRFDERRSGIDHLSYHVDSRADLEAWIEKLDSLGVAHSGIVDDDAGALVSFRDPDNAALELMWVDLEFFAQALVGGDG